ncbi:hypothetical protein TNCV_437501 [Trichonephila clavipes]|nr:hypothetical protein TNCV_437501 [Trichonephila clavipes]
MCWIRQVKHLCVEEIQKPRSNMCSCVILLKVDASEVTKIEHIHNLRNAILAVQITDNMNTRYSCHQSNGSPSKGPERPYRKPSSPQCLQTRIRPSCRISLATHLLNYMGKGSCSNVRGADSQRFFADTLS